MEYSLKIIGLMELVLGLEWGVKLIGCGILDVLFNIFEFYFLNL